MKIKKTNEKQESDLDDRVDGLALCLLHLEEETRQCGLDFTALLIKAAAMSLSFDEQNKIGPAPRAYRRAL